MSSSTSTSLIVPPFSAFLFFPLILSSFPDPDLAAEAVAGAAAVPVAGRPAAAAVSVQPGEGAAEPATQRSVWKTTTVSFGKDQNKAPPTDLFYFEKAVGGSSSR